MVHLDCLTSQERQRHTRHKMTNVAWHVWFWNDKCGMVWLVQKCDKTTLASHTMWNKNRQIPEFLLKNVHAWLLSAADAALKGNFEVRKEWHQNIFRLRAKLTFIGESSSSNLSFAVTGKERLVPPTFADKSWQWHCKSVVNGQPKMSTTQKCWRFWLYWQNWMPQECCLSSFFKHLKSKTKSIINNWL